MKSRYCVILCIILMLLCYLDSALAQDKQLTVTGSVVNVRSGPSLSHSVVTRVSAGDKLALVGEEQDWFKVRLADNRIGWIASWLGQKVESNNPAQLTAPIGVGKVAGTYVNVRSGPGLTFEQVHRVSQGQELTLLGKQGDWYQIQLANQRTGWIAGWLVEVELSQQVPAAEPSLPPSEQPSQLPIEQPNQQINQPQQEVGQGKVVYTMAVALVDNINVRSGVGTIHPILQNLAKGERYPVIGQEQDWLQIQLPNNTTGWVASWLVEQIQVEGIAEAVKQGQQGEQGQENTQTPDVPNYLRVGIIRGDLVNIRQGAGIEFPRVTQAKAGDELIVLAEQDSWYQVQLPTNQQGWVAGQFLTIMEGQQAIALSNSQANTLQGKLIVIDPGHGKINPGGWNDPGAIGPTGLKERDVVTDISHRLKALLEGMGAQVVLTRTEDTTNLTLQERAELANNIKADIFISVHTNASLSANQNGTMVFFFANDPRVQNQRAIRRNLAQELQSELVKELRLTDMGVRESNFVVLRETTMPSVLVEVAFISNPAEERLLADSKFRQRSAEAMAKGVVNFFQKQGTQ